MLPNLPKDSRCTWSILNNFPQAFLCNTPNAGSWQSLNSGDKWIQSILSSQGLTAFFNILQFSWKTWCGIWISLETLTPPDQVPVDAEHQSASTLTVLQTHSQCYKHSQLRAVRFPVVTLSLSVSFSFEDQKSAQYFRFLILTWQNLWTAQDRGSEQPPLEATSQVLSQIREKDDKKQTLWRKDGVFIMAIFLPCTTGSAVELPPLTPGEGHIHTWGFSSLLMGNNSLKLSWCERQLRKGHKPSKTPWNVPRPIPEAFHQMTEISPPQMRYLGIPT